MKWWTSRFLGISEAYNKDIERYSYKENKWLPMFHLVSILLHNVKRNFIALVEASTAKCGISVSTKLSFSGLSSNWARAFSALLDHYSVWKKYARLTWSMVLTDPISHGVGKIEIGGCFLEHSFGVENGREREYDGLATIVMNEHFSFLLIYYHKGT